MSGRRHEHLFAALGALEATLLQGDAIGAEAATQHVLRLLTDTTEPAADERLRPAFDRCQALADALRARLESELRDTAVSSRAAHAYEREAERRP